MKIRVHTTQAPSAGGGFLTGGSSMDVRIEAETNEVDLATMSVVTMLQSVGVAHVETYLADFMEETGADDQSDDQGEEAENDESTEESIIRRVLHAHGWAYGDTDEVAADIYRAFVAAGRGV